MRSDRPPEPSHRPPAPPVVSTMHLKTAAAVVLALLVLWQFGVFGSRVQQRVGESEAAELRASLRFQIAMHLHSLKDAKWNVPAAAAPVAGSGAISGSATPRTAAEGPPELAGAFPFFIGRLNCTPADIMVRAGRFLDKKEATGCPNEGRWLSLMHAMSPAVADKVFINVGTWKGYEMLHWLELWAPHYLVRKKLSRETWVHHMPPGCGFCGQCSARHPTHGAVLPFRQWDVLEQSSGEAMTAPRMIAYEALPALRVPLESLVQKFGLQNVIETRSVIVGDVVGTGQFPNCPQEREDCYINSHHVVQDLMTLPMTTLDAEYERLKLKHIYMLSIDTEGYDPAVLRGARGILSGGHVTVLYFEYHAINLWVKGASLKPTVAELDSYGYDCYLTGNSGLWRLTGCWDDRYEFRNLCRVLCALRTSQERWALEALDLKGMSDVAVTT